MSVLHRLSICGIRSFDPKHEEHVQFSTPVTLFLGQNGCGKTTIIEAIKYACTGELPAGTNGGRGFLNDPKISSQQSTKGAVKIKFFDSKGNEITVGRFMQVMTKGSNVTFKTLLPQIKIQKIGDRGNPHDITGRCNDINAYCSEALNVSSAILNNVLFCHQENSSWPLDEGKKLKERFDEIFDAVKYNKCVDSLRKLYKTKHQEKVLMSNDFKYKKEAKERAESLKAKIEDRKAKLVEINEMIESKQQEQVPIEKRIKEILKLEDTLSELQNILTAKKEERKGIVEQQNSLRKHIVEEFKGTDEELSEEIETFENKRQNLESSIKKLEEKGAELEEELEKTKLKIQKMHVNIGKLREEEKQHLGRCEERKSLIKKAISKLQIQTSSDIDDLAKSEDVINEIKSTLSLLQDSFDELVICKQAEEAELQKNIDEKREKHVSTKQEIVSKINIISESQKKIRECNNKLKDVEIRNKLVNETESKIENVQRTLINVSESIDENEKEQEIMEASEKISNLERHLEKLEREYRILQQNNVTEEKINDQEESIIQKQSKVATLKNKHEDNLNFLFQNNIPDNNISTHVKEILNREEVKMNKLNDNINTLQKEVTTLETEIKIKKNQISQNEKDLIKKQSKIKESCKGEHFDDVLNKSYKKREKLQKDKGQFSSAKVMYEAFINQFKDDSPCCPVCLTDFTNKNTVIKKIINALESKIEKIPEQLRDLETELKVEEEFYNKLQQLKPLSEEILSLSNATLPLLKDDLNDFNEGHTKLLNQLHQAQQDVDIPKKNLEICRNIISDMTLLDQYSVDINNSEKLVNTLKKEIVSVSSKRSRQETEAEIDKIKGELNNTKSICETNKKTLEDHRSRCQKLRIEKEKLMEKLMLFQSALQEKPHLEKEIKENNEKITKVRQEVETLTLKEKQLESELNESINNKNIKCSANREIVQEERTKVNSNKQLVEEITKLQKVINEFIRKKNDVSLKESEEELEQMTEHEKKVNGVKQKISGNVSSKKQEVASLQTTFRALQDNVLLRERAKQEKKLEADIKKLQGQIGDHNYQSVYEEKKKLEKKKEKINQEINTIIGSKDELAKTIKDFENDLKKPENRNAFKEYLKKSYELFIANAVLADLNKYTVALEKSILQFHKDRMVHINKIIRELWRSIYRGNDIDYIEIQTEDAVGTTTKKRSYNYKVIQIKKGIELEMRGRCSAGQRVLACLVIRMALAETFSSHCGILALDEPTTNLDRPNILSLSDALSQIIETRKFEKNFQLLIITHDEEFLNTLTRVQTTPHYWKVSRNGEGFSTVSKVTL